MDDKPLGTEYLRPIRSSAGLEDALHGPEIHRLSLT